MKGYVCYSITHGVELEILAKVKEIFLKIMFFSITKVNKNQSTIQSIQGRMRSEI